MSKRGKKFFADDMQHIYQRTCDGGVMFYDDADRLVFSSIFNHYAYRFDVQLLGLCLMPTHFHAVVRCRTRAIMCKLVQCATSLYARVSNKRGGRSGSVFRESFGRASKFGPKSWKTALAYLYNNPVEKNLSETAEAYRWNFLAYASSENPFSEPLVKRKTSSRMHKAVLWFKIWKRCNNYLTYNILNDLFCRLDSREKEQMTDYLIRSFTKLDFDFLTKLYSSQEDMIRAFNSNTGSEYDLNEEKGATTDLPFLEIERALREKDKTGKWRLFRSWKSETRLELADYLVMSIGVGEYYVRKFLHLVKEECLRE